MGAVARQVAIVTVALLATGAARAQEEAAPVAAAAAAPAAPHAEIGARTGYYSPPVHGGTTPFGVGLGARIGYSFGTFYLGGTGLFFFGGSDVDTTNHGALYGGELGASFYVPAFGSAYLVFRPHVGLGGVTVFHTEPSSATGTTTTTRGGRTRGDSLATATGTDVITAASVGGGGSSGGLFGSGTTTSVTSFYVEPGVTVLLSSGTPTGGAPFAGLNASTLILPSVVYGGSTPSTWLSFSLGGELGLMF